MPKLDGGVTAAIAASITVATVAAHPFNSFATVATVGTLTAAIHALAAFAPRIVVAVAPTTTPPALFAAKFLVTAFLTGAAVGTPRRACGVVFVAIGAVFAVSVTGGFVTVFALFDCFHNFVHGGKTRFHVAPQLLVKWVIPNRFRPSCRAPWSSPNPAWLGHGIDDGFWALGLGQQGLRSSLPRGCPRCARKHGIGTLALPHAAYDSRLLGESPKLSAWLLLVAVDGIHQALTLADFDFTGGLEHFPVVQEEDVFLVGGVVLYASCLRHWAALSCI
jgi:hypothetical protein